MEGRERKTIDFTYIKCVKGKKHKVIIYRKNIKRKWKKNFRAFLNEEFLKENQGKVE